MIFMPIIAILLCSCYCSEDEYRLLQDLRTGYDPVERPVKNHSTAVNVKVRILLQQVLDVDEKNQVVTLVVWTQMTWKDYKMRWDPDEYGGITSIQLPPGSLWKPDVLLFNTADEHFDASFPVNMAVQYTGEVLMAPPSIVKLSCNIDLTYFPFDDQLCHLKYGSWTYTGTKVDLTIDDVGLNKQHQMDLLYYVPNGEWQLLGTPAERVANEFNGEKYVELYFRMHLKRRTLYYGLNWVVPSILLSLSNVLGFTLPPECGEKITLQFGCRTERRRILEITNLLSVLVFLAMVSDITPPTSESIPVIVAFFSASMLILGLSVISTILIINIHFRSPSTHRMPNWMCSLLLEWLPWMLAMNRPGTKFRRPGRKEEDNYDEPTLEKVQAYVTRRNDCDTLRLLRKDSQKIEPTMKGLITSSRAAVDNDYSSYSSPTERLLKEIHKILLFYKEKLVEQEEEESQSADWKFVGMVLDRFCLFLFTGAYLLTILTMVTATPRLFDNSAIIK